MTTLKKKNSNTSFVLSVCLMVALIVSLMVPTAMAWFTDYKTQPGNTVVEFGTVNVDPLDGVTAQNYRIGEQTAVEAGKLSKVLPGDTVKYTVAVKNTGSVGAYAITTAGIRFLYNNSDITDFMMPYVEDLSNLTTDGTTYFYEMATSEEVTLAGSFVFSTDLPNEVGAYILNYKGDPDNRPEIKLVIDIQVYAIQKDNITLEEAQTHLETVSNINTSLQASSIVATTGTGTVDVTVSAMSNKAKAQLATYQSQTGVSSKNVIAAADISTTETTAPTLTFDVSDSGLEAGDDVLALHYDEDLSIWETVEICEVDENQKVTVSNLTSLSPIALVAVEDGIGQTEENPLPINNAKDFLTYTSTENQCHLKLTSDIDMEFIINNELIPLETLADNGGFVMDAFTKTIDGDGHKIIHASEFNGGIYVFDNFIGTLKNTTLSYEKVKDGEAMWFSYWSRGNIEFQNVIVENVDKNINSDGVLNITQNNFSPFVMFLKGNKATFTNCTNNLNFAGPKYASTFIGGYIMPLNVSDVVDANDQPTGKKEGFVKNVTLEFTNCINNGNLKMESASMFIGNAQTLPIRENIIVSGCKNYGSIEGSLNADILCALGEGSVGPANDHRRVILPLWNDEIAQLVKTDTGVCFVSTLTGFTATFGKDRLITINNDAEGEFVYDIRVVANVGYADSSSRIEALIRIEDEGLTNIGRYNVRDKAFIDGLNVQSRQQISEARIVSKLSDDIKLYLVTDTSNNKYYYFEVNGGEFDYSIGAQSHMYVTAYSVNEGGVTEAAVTTVDEK